MGSVLFGNAKVVSEVVKHLNQKFFLLFIREAFKDFVIVLSLAFLAVARQANDFFMEITVTDFHQGTLLQVGHDDRPVVGQVIIDEFVEEALHRLLVILKHQTAQTFSLGIVVRLQLHGLKHLFGHIGAVQRLPGITNGLVDGRPDFTDADKVVEVSSLQSGILSGIHEGQQLTVGNAFILLLLHQSDAFIRQDGGGGTATFTTYLGQLGPFAFRASIYHARSRVKRHRHGHKPTLYLVICSR